MMFRRLIMNAVRLGEKWVTQLMAGMRGCAYVDNVMRRMWRRRLMIVITTIVVLIVLSGGSVWCDAPWALDKPCAFECYTRVASINRHVIHRKSGAQLAAILCGRRPTRMRLSEKFQIALQITSKPDDGLCM
jgi:hypothetical protein